MTKCIPPNELPIVATIAELAQWAVSWIGAYGCEKSKREALIESWPK